MDVRRVLIGIALLGAVANVSPVFAGEGGDYAVPIAPTTDVRGEGGDYLVPDSVDDLGHHCFHLHCSPHLHGVGSEALISV